MFDMVVFPFSDAKAGLDATKSFEGVEPGSPSRRRFVRSMSIVDAERGTEEAGLRRAIESEPGVRKEEIELRLGGGVCGGVAASSARAGDSDLEGSGVDVVVVAVVVGRLPNPLSRAFSLRFRAKSMLSVQVLSPLLLVVDTTYMPSKGRDSWLTRRWWSYKWPRAADTLTGLLNAWRLSYGQLVRAVKQRANEASSQSFHKMRYACCILVGGLVVVGNGNRRKWSYPFVPEFPRV